MSLKAPTDSSFQAEVLMDFPDWLSPMLVKEFRQGLRAGSFVLLLVALHLGVVLVEAFGLAASVEVRDTDFVGTSFWAAVYAMLLLGAPLRGLAGLHAERQSRTLELLGAAGVSGTQLAWGKWIALMTQSFLMAFSLLPYFVLRYFTGGVDLALDARLMALAVMASAVCVAAALAASGLQRAVVRGGLGAVFCLGFIICWGFTASLLHEPTAAAALNQMDRGWLLLFAGCLLSVVVLLRLAGDAVGPASNNGAVLPRLLLVPGWALLWVPSLRHVEPAVLVGYQWLMGLLTLVVFAWHLGESRVFEAHLRPFVRMGLPGRLVAVLLLPHWVGCLWILPLAAGVLVTVVQSLVAHTFLLLFGASLVSGVLLWRTCFPRVRNLFGMFALYAVLGGLASGISFALQARLESRWLAFLPTFGYWRYASLHPGTPHDLPTLPEWRQTAFAAFTIYLLACGVPALFWLRREVWPRWRER